jgi:hypothetical protein
MRVSTSQLCSIEPSTSCIEAAILTLLILARNHVLDDFYYSKSEWKGKGLDGNAAWFGLVLQDVGDIAYCQPDATRNCANGSSRLSYYPLDYI